MNYTHGSKFLSFLQPSFSLSLVEDVFAFTIRESTARGNVCEFGSSLSESREQWESPSVSGDETCIVSNIKDIRDVETFHSFEEFFLSVQSDKNNQKVGLRPLSFVREPAVVRVYRRTAYSLIMKYIYPVQTSDVAQRNWSYWITCTILLIQILQKVTFS